MSLSSELQRLADLKASGVLSESEFQRAKDKLLNEDASPRETEDNSLGRAANRYVSLQMISAVIVILIFLFVIAPKMCSQSQSGFGPPGF